MTKMLNKIYEWFFPKKVIVPEPQKLRDWIKERMEEEAKLDIERQLNNPSEREIMKRMQDISNRLVNDQIKSSQPINLGEMSANEPNWDNVENWDSGCKNKYGKEF